MKETNYYDHFMSIGGHSDALFKFLKWKNSKIFQFFRNNFAKRIREKISKIWDIWTEIRNVKLNNLCITFWEYRHLQSDPLC